MLALPERSVDVVCWGTGRTIVGTGLVLPVPQLVAFLFEEEVLCLYLTRVKTATSRFAHVCWFMSRWRLSTVSK